MGCYWRFRDAVSTRQGIFNQFPRIGRSYDGVRTVTMRQSRVLLGQLASNGDCIYATTVARQIKSDDPSCHLTWAIASFCRHIIDHNPHVDAVWEVPVGSRGDVESAWRQFEMDARRRQRSGEFHDVHLTQIHPGNYQNYDGTVRPSIFRGYPRPMTVPVTPVIRLGDDELERAHSFARAHRLAERAPVVLFECNSYSGQSFVTTDWATEVSRGILRELPNGCVIITSSKGFDAEHPSILDGSVLRFRENAELTRYCSLLIGCSSGITWLCTSDAATTIPMIQFLRRSAGMYGAVVHDLEYFGLPSEHIIEMHECTPDHAARCAIDVLKRGVFAARAGYHQPVQLNFDAYQRIMLGKLVHGELRTVVTSLRHTVHRYGLPPSLATSLCRQALDGATRAVAKRLSKP
jgi:hypothetical protein